MKKATFGFERISEGKTRYVLFHIQNVDGSKSSVKIPGGYYDNIDVYQDETNYFLIACGLFHVAPMENLEAFRLHRCCLNSEILFNESALISEKYIVLENCREIIVIDNDNNYRMTRIDLGTSSKISHGINPEYVVINRYSLVEGDPNRSRKSMDDYPPSEERRDEIILNLLTSEFSYKLPDTRELIKGTMVIVSNN